MRFTNVIETHITNVGINCCEVLDALKKKFPDRQVDYLIGGQYQTFQGYKLSGSITKQETKAIMRLVAKTIEKRNDDNDKSLKEAKEFMKDWTPADIPLPTDDVLRALRESIDEMLGYVESHRKGDPEMAKSFAMDSEDMVAVYNLWHAKDFKAAAKYLRDLDTIVRDRVPSKEYRKIMEHYPR